MMAQPHEISSQLQDIRKLLAEILEELREIRRVG